ncbi:hypothetical protein BU14_0104s0005 [Porphyra umbilicalis]|uniref:Uncharacterized protein n=1 Tax=Porphyra umbilicalis TaxID=2786 RepID=A0A1X6PCM0_PORUM|nr:hypothetical protein BU14_0104s0005 [Porphyra umbilicalis]|eukprot:OSX78631.1 hypothetical protein BU14_0104s0005 [Porphyra umbilicalis]
MTRCRRATRLAFRVPLETNGAVGCHAGEGGDERVRIRRKVGGDAGWRGDGWRSRRGLPVVIRRRGRAAAGTGHGGPREWVGGGDDWHALLAAVVEVEPNEREGGGRHEGKDHPRDGRQGGLRCARDAGDRGGQRSGPWLLEGGRHRHGGRGEEGGAEDPRDETIAADGQRGGGHGGRAVRVGWSTAEVGTGMGKGVDPSGTGNPKAASAPRRRTCAFEGGRRLSTAGGHAATEPRSHGAGTLRRHSDRRGGTGGRRARCRCHAPAPLRPATKGPRAYRLLAPPQRRTAGRGPQPTT